MKTPVAFLETDATLSVRRTRSFAAGAEGGVEPFTTGLGPGAPAWVSPPFSRSWHLLLARDSSQGTDVPGGPPAMAVSGRLCHRARQAPGIWEGPPQRAEGTVLQSPPPGDRAGTSFLQPPCEGWRERDGRLAPQP